MDKDTLEGKLGMASQNVKHDSYFNWGDAQDTILRLQTDHDNEPKLVSDLLDKSEVAQS